MVTFVELLFMKTILSILLFSFLFIACNDNDDGTILPGVGGNDEDSLPPPTDTFYVSQELKSYYFFPENSWWVYQRTDTNAVIYDTAVVASVYSELEYSRFLPFAWEAAAVGITHSYYKAPEGFVNPKLSVGIGNLNGNTDRISMSSEGKLFQSLPDYFSVPIDSLSIANKTSPIIFSSLIDTNSIVLTNYSFQNAIHLRSGIENFVYEIFLVKEVGLVKYFNVDDSTNWELINYEIKK